MLTNIIEWAMDVWTDIRDGWNEGWPCRLAIITVTVIVLSVPLLVWAAIVEDREWEKFKVDHKCRIVSYQPSTSSTGTGLSPKGEITTVVVTTPDKTGWLCDDGVTYYR